jgi:glucosyl-dolichyl phosphate glucuronosyltransferase
MISVVICTYNRAESLRKTLASVSHVRLKGEIEWELIVIDNNSPDHTRQIVEEFEHQLPVRYCFEEVQGLSAARNRALKEFSGSHLLFTDDDVLVDPDWLRCWDDAIRRFAQAGFFGGKVTPFYPAGKPTWLFDEGLALIDGLLVRFHLGDEVRPFTSGEPTPFGANFALSRACIERVGSFRTDLGVKGGIPGRGEEADYMERAMALGETGVYVGTAIVNHATDPNRLTLGYLYRYGVQKGIAAKLMGSTVQGSKLRAIWHLVRGTFQLIKGRGDRMRQCVINAGIERGRMMTPPNDKSSRGTPRGSRE